MNIYENSLLKRISNKFFNISPNICYSQNGEDIIVNFLKCAKNMQHFTWLDIGANHPSKFSNTFMFYNQGFYGTSVEPNPSLVNLHKKIRKKDNIIQAGIGFSNEIESKYFLMQHHELNTFSEEEANRMEKDGLSKIIRTMNVELIPVNDLLNEYYKNKPLSFLNLDVEGLDYQILNSWDFKICKPKIICVETIGFTSNATSPKNMEIINYLKDLGYAVFADTYINTIFYAEN